MHMSEVRCLDGVVGIDGIRDPVFSIIIRMSCYLHFISYMLTLASFCAVSLYWRRLSSYILSWVCDGVSLDVGNVSCIVGNIAIGVAGAFAGALAAGLAGALAAALAAGLTGCTTSFSPRPSSATGSRGPLPRRRWRGRSDLLLE
jgi:hypothetical protein